MVRLRLGLNRKWGLGTLKVSTEESTLQCMANLYVVPPRPHGVMLTPDDPGFRFIRYKPSRPPPRSFMVDLNQLLAGTTWPVPGSRSRP
jgi:hypothetical protein